MCSYISSLSAIKEGYFCKTFAKSFNSSLEYTEPVGLQGVEKSINFVFGVIAASS